MCICCGYSQKNEVRYTCYCCCSIIWCILFALFVGIFIIPYNSIHDYEANKCNIIQVDYPTTLPTFNNVNGVNGWGSCYCGRGCTSWSPCIRLYSDVDEAIMIKETYYVDRNDKCTFHNNNCPNGENIQYIQAHIDASRATANKYLNTTVDCYYNTPTTNIYLDNNMSMTNIYFICVMMILLIIMCCVVLYTDNKCSCKSESKDLEKATVLSPAYMV
jgi:hypothetical protein